MPHEPINLELKRVEKEIPRLSAKVATAAEQLESALKLLIEVTTNPGRAIHPHRRPRIVGAALCGRPQLAFRSPRCHYGFTTLIGLPSRKACRFSTAKSISRVRLSFGAQAICGVIRQFFAVSRGLLPAIGSLDTTSRPAA